LTTLEGAFSESSGVLQMYSSAESQRDLLLTEVRQTSEDIADFCNYLIHWGSDLLENYSLVHLIPDCKILALAQT
jgi:hypothetical protein